MARLYKPSPGPTGTSCLTCRQRHKKCDQRRPVCERCEKGEFECLGYSHNEPNVARSSLWSGMRRPILPNPDTISVTSTQARPQTDDSSRMGHTPMLILDRKNTVQPDLSSLGLLPLPPEDNQLLSTLEVVVTVPGTSTSDTVDQGLPSGPATGPPKLPVRSLAQPTQISSGFYSQIPYTPYHLSKTLLDSSILEDYIMAHWDRMIKWAYFKPVIPMSQGGLKSLIISRLRESELARWIMFIITRVCESLADGDTSQDHKYELWISQIDQTFRSASPGSRNTVTIQRRHGYWLQVLLIKTMFSQGMSAYQVLRYATPLFLQMVYSDSSYWLAGCDPTLVPLAGVIVSVRYELSHFTFLDAVTAMAFGLPQQVEYSYTFNRDSPQASYSSYTHCCPVEFQVTLAEINACRDHSPSARRWVDIEQTILSLRPRPSEHEKGWESWMAVAWLAVQESWRHMLLVYLYMSVCGVASDDPRVRSSVRQFFQMADTIKGRESSNGKAPLFFQYLMAGICARSEKHRSMARKHLTSASYTKSWPLRALDFALVLDYLWHGVAAGGRPIKWVDYVGAREKILPVGV